MNKKAPFDYDAAMAALKIDERSARPVVSEGLLTRVLGDAAEVAGAAVPPPAIPKAGRPERSGGFRLLGLFDAWSGAAFATLALCLGIGLGIGYGAGSELMSQTGLGDVEITLAAEESDGLFPSEDVL